MNTLLFSAMLMGLLASAETGGAEFCAGLGLGSSSA